MTRSDLFHAIGVPRKRYRAHAWRVIESGRHIRRDPLDDEGEEWRSEWSLPWSRGWVYKTVRDKGKRDVYSTVRYELTHCGLGRYLRDTGGVGRFDAITWVGYWSAGNVKVERKKVLTSDKCPVCGGVMCKYYEDRDGLPTVQGEEIIYKEERVKYKFKGRRWIQRDIGGEYG